MNFLYEFKLSEMGLTKLHIVKDHKRYAAGQIVWGKLIAKLACWRVYSEDGHMLGLIPQAVAEKMRM